MSKPKIISSFNQFERIYESVENGTTPVNEDEINEGIFSGIMNFFSRVFGGRIDDLDSILSKYKKNESTYWGKWADANHSYNKAAVQKELAATNVDQRKHLEMMERSNKLIRQATKSRHEINDALERQAMIMIRGNQRLRSYWEMKKAKMDERVASQSYKSLKKEVDEDTVEELYDRVKETEAKAKKKLKVMPKGTSTIEFGDYKDASDEKQEVSMNKFGIHDLDDFIYADDELWNERVKLMPQANLEVLAGHLKDTIAKIETDTTSEIRKVKKKLETAEGDKRERLDREWKHVKEYGDDDIERLEDRLAQLKGEGAASTATSEPKETEEEEIDPTTGLSTNDEAYTFAKRVKESHDKISEKIGDVGEKELGYIMNDMISLYKKLPTEDKDEDKEEDIRMVQLIDFATDIYEFRQKNQISGETTGDDLDTMYTDFKKEFPK